MAEPRVHRRLAAIAIADVVGYSRLMGRDESGTLARLNARRLELIAPCVAAHDGRIVKLLGDGFFLEFSSATAALQAALAIQAGMAEANAELPDDQRMVLRIGLNLGEVIVEGDDLFGDGINVAARLESIAPHGGIALSASAYEQVRLRVAVEAEDAGLQALKNIAEPVRVYRISPLAIGAATSAGPASWMPAVAAPLSPSAAAPAAPEPRPSIAVLPFANLGDDAEQGYFSDGIAEDIITELSRWQMLAVRSRSASFRYRDVGVDLAAVARELQVRYLLEGSVRRLGERIRITAQLIDADSGDHVWAERFDRPVQDLFAVQDEVVRTIVSTLVGRVQAAAVDRAGRKPPASLAAYECMLRGNALPWAQPEGFAEATRLFEQAVALDPEYGFAHTLLAVLRYVSWLQAPPGDDRLLHDSMALAQRGVALSPGESTCHSILSVVHLLQRNFDVALRTMERALSLNPSNQWNLADRGVLAMYLGEHEEALRWLERAQQADPYFDADWLWRTRAQALLHLDRDAEALATLARSRLSAWRSLAVAAASHARLGEAAAAQASARELLALWPEFRIATFIGREPYRRVEDAQRHAEALRRAGLPE